MTPAELREEIDLELDLIQATLDELSALHHDTKDRQPTVREKTAAAGFLAQFYNGIENILKRISHYYEVILPSGETWHIDLFRRFSEPPEGQLPALFDPELAILLAPFRKFRHVVMHGYGFQLDWERMREGVDTADTVFAKFRHRLDSFLSELER